MSTAQSLKLENTSGRQDKPASPLKTRRMLGLIAALAVAVVLTACGASNADTEEVQADLVEFNDDFNEAAAGFDVDALVSIYSEESLWIAPGTPPAEGLDVPTQNIQFLAEAQGSLTHTIDQLIISDDGNLAVMIGETDVLVESAGLDSLGTYVYVLERDGDDWKVAVDMFNQYADEPAE